jgi:class 3 adenylate cyclase
MTLKARILGPLRVCLACQTENPNSARFCIQCGRAFGASCAQCGEELPSGARFCPSCGASVVASEPAPAEMLKLVTVLFADVVSSTARAENMHPEDVRSLMAENFEAMSQEIRREGGTIEKFIGDAVMAVFGVPATHEDDAVRAVRAGERMLERLARLNAGRDKETRIQVRIGINTGEVLAAGAPGSDLLVTGDTVNVAARLQELADPGSILVGDRTARAIRGCFHVKPVEALEVRGRSGPVGAWIVAGEEEMVERAEQPGVAARMIGRASEIALLRMLFDRVRSERLPHLVTIIGEAGVGKTRLVAEFVTALEAEGRVVGSRCPPYGEGLILWPLAKILKAEAEILDSDSPELASERIEKLVADLPDALVPDRDRTVEALALTLGLPRAGGNERDSRTTYRDLADAWRSLLGSMAQDAPLIVVIEDLHWADEALLEVLAELADRLNAPVMFLATARPELLQARSDWGGGRRSYSSVSIDPLTHAESSELLSSLLDGAPIADNLRELVLGKAEGNPFFMEEILRHLIDEGRLKQVNGRWSAEDDGLHAEIPDDVQAVILARIDLLDPMEKRALQHAAVVGRTFWSGAVKELSGAEDLEPTLRTLQQKEFTTERVMSSIAGETEYHFKHILIRDVAYESLPRRARGEAHAAVAKWIERLGADRLHERSELLALHYRKAYAYLSDDGYRVLARMYCMAASRSAYRKAAFGRAEWFGRRAADLSLGAAETVEALEVLGDTHFLGENAWQAYTDAISKSLAKRPDDRATIGRLCAKATVIVTRWRGSMLRTPDVKEIKALIDLGLQHAEEPDRALLLASKAFLQFMGYERVDATATEASREALEIAERNGDPNLISAALDAVAGCLMPSGRYGEVYRIQSRRMELLPRLRINEACDAYGMMAWACTVMGRYAEGHAAATTGTELAADHNPGAMMHTLTWRTHLRFITGDWDGALEDQRRIESIQEAVPGDATPLPYSIRAYAVVLLMHELLGNDAETTRYWDLIANFAKHASDHSGRLSQSRGLIARTLLHQGKLAEARELIEEERDPVSVCQLEFKSFHLEALCDIVAAQGDWDIAPAVIEEVRREAALGEIQSLPYWADRLEGQLAAARGDIDAATALLRRSAEGFSTLGAVWDEAYSRLLLGQTLDSPHRMEQLRAAHDTFVRLGSVREIEQTAETPGGLETG